ncbi:MAG: hypothetical protein AB7O88_10870 [Reyranellaceae bacterium]
MVKEVYLLKHRNELPDGFRDDKFIGLYSSAAGAQAAIERTRKLPGFRDAPNGFSVRKIRIDEDLFANPA